MTDGQQNREQQSPGASDTGISGDLSQELQRQIEQAIEPVLADFRLQVERSVDQQAKQDMRSQTNGRGAHEESQQMVSTSAQDVAQDRGTQQTTSQQAPSQEAQQNQANQSHEQIQDNQHQENARSESTQQSQQQTGTTSSPPAPPNESGTSGPPAKRSGSGSLMQTATSIGEQVGAQALQALITAALTALLSENTRSAAENKADATLHSLIDTTFQKLPNNPTTQELRSQTDKILIAVLKELLDAVYSQSVKDELERHGKAAANAIAHGNVDAAGNEAQAALEELVQALLPVLRRQWQRLLRLVVKTMMAALEDSLDVSDEVNKLTSQS